jgi:NTE family protein
MERLKDTLFCWSGGGIAALDVHVGVWLALDEIGIRATANAGTSAGAIVAAMNSAGLSAIEGESILRSLSDGDIRRELPFWKVRIPWLQNFLDPEPIQSTLETHLPYHGSLLQKPLSLFATNEREGTSHEFRDPGRRLLECVMASVAVPGVFPPVMLEGEKYSDGCTTANLPLPADWREYNRVVLIVASRPIRYHRRSSILSRLLMAVDILAEDQMRDTIERAKTRPNVHLFRSPFDFDRGALHFEHGLIGQAYHMVMTAWKQGKDGRIS